MNFHLSWLCVDMASMSVSWHKCYNLVNVLFTEIFMTWVVFMKQIFSCLNLKPDDGFLPYSMPEVFNKTGYGLAGIIAWDEFKPVLHPEFLGT